jgi:hypothetical protein
MYYKTCGTNIWKDQGKDGEIYKRVRNRQLPNPWVEDDDD